MLTTQSFPLLSDICGAADIGDLDPIVAQLAPNAGTLVRGTVLSVGGTGKLVLTTAGNEQQAFGVLLDEVIDTTVAFSDGSVTGSVRRHGSYKAAMLIVGVGADPVKITSALRQNGILLEGQLVVSTSLDFQERRDEPAETAGPTR